MTNDETLLPKYEVQLQQLAADLGLSEVQREWLSYRQLQQALNDL